MSRRRRRRRKGSKLSALFQSSKEEGREGGEEKTVFLSSSSPTQSRGLEGAELGSEGATPPLPVALPLSQAASSQPFSAKSEDRGGVRRTRILNLRPKFAPFKPFLYSSLPHVREKGNFSIFLPWYSRLNFSLFPSSNAFSMSFRTLLPSLVSLFFLLLICGSRSRVRSISLPLSSPSFSLLCSAEELAPQRGREERERSTVTEREEERERAISDNSRSISNRSSSTASLFPPLFFLFFFLTLFSFPLLGASLKKRGKERTKLPPSLSSRSVSGFGLPSSKMFHKKRVTPLTRSKAGGNEQGVAVDQQRRR
jgi:hypothetical protein